MNKRSAQRIAKKLNAMLAAPTYHDHCTCDKCGKSPARHLAEERHFICRRCEAREDRS